MNVREKLVELLTEFYGCDPMYYNVDALAIADHLISNGVTVQEWISVKDRLPENSGLYLVIQKHWLDGSLGTKIAKWNTADWFTADRKSKEITPRITHWMPIPQPPKGE